MPNRTEEAQKNLEWWQQHRAELVRCGITGTISPEDFGRLWGETGKQLAKAEAWMATAFEEDLIDDILASGQAALEIAPEARTDADRLAMDLAFYLVEELNRSAAGQKPKRGGLKAA